MKFNLKKYAGPRRIKDRGINWKQAYREKSDDLKRRFDSMLGPGSYFRWEGHDYTTNSDYFVVTGPAVTKNGKKMFFAGIKKLPKDKDKKHHYAPYGEYFGSMHSALSHCSEKWGVTFPKGSPNYTMEQLAPIKVPRHVKGHSYNSIKTSWKDQLPGGLADKKKPRDFEQYQLEEGKKVELEHVDDNNLSTEIAMDHLTEDSKYYDKLKRMENRRRE